MDIYTHLYRFELGRSFVERKLERVGGACRADEVQQNIPYSFVEKKWKVLCAVMSLLMQIYLDN